MEGIEMTLEQILLLVNVGGPALITLLDLVCGMLPKEYCRYPGFVLSILKKINAGNISKVAESLQNANWKSGQKGFLQIRVLPFSLLICFLEIFLPKISDFTSLPKISLGI